MGLNNLKKEREKLKNASLNQKLEFFWDYYKWPAVSVMIVLAVIGSFVHSAVMSKDVILSGICLNCYQSSFEPRFDTLTEAFLQDQNLDPSEFAVEINTSLIYAPGDENAAETNYQTVQRIGAQITAKDLDFAVGNLEAMLEFAYTDTFCDLSLLLSEEELARYEPYLLYVDLAVVEAVLDQPQADIQWLDCKSPEKMERPVPVLIDMSSCGALMENYPYLQETLALGVAVNAPHEDMIPSLIDFLMHDYE